MLIAVSFGEQAEADLGRADRLRVVFGAAGMGRTPVRPEQRPLREAMIIVAKDGEGDSKSHEFGQERSALGKGGTDENNFGSPLTLLFGAELARGMGDLVGGHEDPQNVACTVLISLLDVAGAHDDE